MVIDSRELSGIKEIVEPIIVDSIIVDYDNRRPINELKVTELVKSISEIGLLHPIVITDSLELVAGLHRLTAFKRMRRLSIPCKIVDSSDKILIELIQIDENLIRNEDHFLVRGSNLRRKKQLYEKRYPEIKHGGDRKSEIFKTKPSRFDFQNTFSQDTAKIAGISPRTIEQEIQLSRDILPEVQEVIKKREIGKKEALLIAREEPEVQEKIVQKLVSGTNTVKIALIKIRREEKPRHTPVLPEGLFNVILADPAWKYDFYVSENRSPENHYRTMELEDICKLEIPSARDSILFLWATTAKLDWAMKVIEAWGFTFKTSMVWIKDKIGMGHYVRNQHEFVLIATKGFPGIPLPSTRPSSVFHSPRTQHSKKPSDIYNLIEQMYPNRDYLELFARDSRENWTPWGNEL